MRVLLPLTALALVAVFSDSQGAGKAPSSPGEKAERLEQIVQSYYESGSFEGVALVAEKGEVLLETGVGQANREWGIPNSPETRFMIASITKQFTAMLVMQLVADGLLELEGTISDYLPYYREDTGSTITLRNLLQHTSGLPEGVTELDQYDDALALMADRPEFVRRFWMGDPQFEPGTAFSYTNTDYGVVGAILEEVTGSSYEDLLQFRILDPLGMKDTGLEGYGRFVPRHATGYVRVPATGPSGSDRFELRPYLGQPGYAAAGMYSTARDLFLWNQAVLNSTLLSAELTQIMFDPLIGIDESVGNYVALGSWVYDRALPEDRKIRLIERRGYISPFTLLNVIAPEEGYSIILLSNHDPADIHGLPYAPGLPYDILLTLCDLPAEGPQQSP